MPVTERVVEAPIGELERHYFSSVRDYPLRQDLVEVYAEHLDHLPLPVAWWTGQRWECLDGRHRTAAGRTLGRTAMRCRVFEGSPEEAQLFMLSINTQHGWNLNEGERNAAIKRALRLDLGLSSRQLGQRFNCSHTQVVHQRRVMAVEDAYQRHLSVEGVPDDERAERLRRLGQLADRVVLRLHEIPEAEWGPLLDRLPADRWAAEYAVSRVVKELSGAPAPTSAPAGDPAAAEQPADAVPQASDPVDHPVDHMAQGVADDHIAASVRRIEAHNFELVLEQVLRRTKEVQELLPLIVEVCTPAQQAAAQTIADVWRAVAEGAEQYQQQERTRAAGDPAPDDDVPFTG